MKATIQGVIIFPLAFGAHLEAAHRGLRAVVWYILDDGKARPAVSAVSERIAIAPILR